MSNISKLDSIIRSIESTNELEPDEILVIYDEKNNRILPKVPRFSILNRPQYFAVSTTNIVRCEGIKAPLPSSVILSISYHVSCPFDNEEKVIKSLFRKKTNFEETLNHKVKSWVVSYLSENSEETIFNDRDILSKYLVDRCNDQVGLKIVPRIGFQNEDSIDSIDISSQSLEVRVSDYKKALQLSYKTRLKILESDVIKAYTSFDKTDRLRSDIRKEIEDYFSNSVNLHDFCYKLNSIIADELKLKIERKISVYGRKLSFLELESPTIKNLVPNQNPLRVEQPVNNCLLADFRGGINVESILILDLVDVGKLVNSEIINFPVEIKESLLPKLIQSVLWNKKYKDIVLRLDEVKLEIESRIEEEMNSYGYVVKQHTFIPNLNQIKLNSEGFDIQLEKEKFTTSDIRVPLNLNIDISGLISNLEELPSNLLKPNSDIEAEIIASVKKLIRTHINRIDPQTAYTEYAFNPHGDSVQHILEESVKKAIIEKYKIDSQSLKVSIKLAQSEITEKVSCLTSKSHTFSTNVMSKRGQQQKYNESIDFQIRYNVLGVSDQGWAAFQQRAIISCEDEIVELATLLDEKSRSILESVPYEKLVSGDAATKVKVHNLLQLRVLSDIGARFGLNLGLISVNRSKTHSEILAEESYREGVSLDEKNAVEVKQLEIGHIKENLEMLYKRKQALLEAEEFEDALEVDKQIEAIKKRSSMSNLDEGIDNMNNKWIGSPDEKEFDFDELFSTDETKRIGDGNVD